MWAAGELLLREIQIILGITLKNRKLQFKDLQLKNKIHKKCYPSKVLCQIEYKTRRVCDEINNNNRNQEKRTWLCPGSPGGKIIVVEKISWWKISWWKIAWWKKNVLVEIYLLKQIFLLPNADWESFVIYILPAIASMSPWNFLMCHLDVAFVLVFYGNFEKFILGIGFFLCSHNT